MKRLPELTEQELRRYWSHVNVQGPDDCWPWIRTHPESYGRTRIYFRGSGFRPHRVAYFLHHNIDPDVHPVKHTCGFLDCCNPNHMYLNPPRRESAPFDVLTKEARKRFLSKVNQQEFDDCWLWTGKIHHAGYGLFKHGCISYAAHRVSYFLHTGIDPGPTLVCHTCDTPLCVNPKHLWLGTDEDNTRDRDIKARGPVGGRHGGVKLTEDQVLEIHARLATGEGCTSIAKDYIVGRAAIAAISRGVTWTHLI